MKIGVLSDTHIPNRAKSLPPILLETFQGVDHILHAGDITGDSVLYELEAIAPVTAVAGNMDSWDVYDRFGEKKIERFGRFRFGLYHGHGFKLRTADRALERFQDDRVDCIVFGHSHMPYCKYHGNILLFNPGSPTDKRMNRYYSFGIIETGEVLSPRIIFFNADGIVSEQKEYPN